MSCSLYCARPVKESDPSLIYDTTIKLECMIWHFNFFPSTLQQAFPSLESFIKIFSTPSVLCITIDYYTANRAIFACLAFHDLKYNGI